MGVINVHVCTLLGDGAAAEDSAFLFLVAALVRGMLGNGKWTGGQKVIISYSHDFVFDLFRCLVLLLDADLFEICTFPMVSNFHTLLTYSNMCTINPVHA